MSSIKDLQQAAIQPLEHAKSIPFTAFTDPAVLEAESEKIFSNEWVFICMEGEVPKPGDYFAMTLANEPLIVIRGDDNDLQALSNICRHRGTTILDQGVGHVDKYITCPYHAGLQ